MNIDSAVITAIATSLTALIGFFKYRRDKMNGPAFGISHIRRQGDFMVCRVSVTPPTSHHLRFERITCNGKGVALTRLGADGKVEFVSEHAHASRLAVDVQMLSSTTSSRQHVFDISIRLRKRQSSARISFHTSANLLCVRYKTPAIKASEMTDTIKHND